MSRPGPNRVDLQHTLESELSRSLIDSAGDGDADQNLAVINSVCLLVLLIGIVGSERAYIRIEPLSTVNETTAAIVEPLPAPAETSPSDQAQEPNEEQSAQLPEAVIATPEVPTIQFPVPTIGHLV